MLVSQIGDNAITRALSTAASAGKGLVTDSRFQKVAVTAATQYAPEKTAQVQSYAAQVQAAIRAAQGQPHGRPPAPPPMPMPMPMPEPASPVQSGNLIWFGVGGAALLLFLLMRR